MRTAEPMQPQMQSISSSDSLDSESFNIPNKLSFASLGGTFSANVGIATHKIPCRSSSVNCIVFILFDLVCCVFSALFAPNLAGSVHLSRQICNKSSTFIKYSVKYRHSGCCMRHYPLQYSIEPRCCLSCVFKQLRGGTTYLYVKKGSIPPWNPLKLLTDYNTQAARICYVICPLSCTSVH